MSNEIVVLIVSSFVTSLGAILVSIISNRGAAKKNEVSALSELVYTLQNENARLVKRVDCLEIENQRLREVTNNQEGRIEELERENGDLREWAEGLYHQVVELRGTPIEMRKHRSKKQ